MEFFYLFLSLLAFFYVWDFWKAHRSKQPWLLKKLNPFSHRVDVEAWTGWDESPSEEKPRQTLREIKDRHVQQREAEASLRNQRNEEIFETYENMLHESLQAQHFLDFNSLYEPVPLPESSVPSHLVQCAAPPKIENFRQSRWVEILSRLYPGHASRLINADEEQSYLYQHALEVWEDAEKARISALQLYKAEFERQYLEAVTHNELIVQKKSRLNQNYLSGDEFVVAAYVKKILESSPYPKSLPRKTKVTYVGASKQVVVDFELPKIDVIPDHCDYRYVKASDKIASKRRKTKDIDDDYTKLISAIALKVLHEVFASDNGSVIEVCCFNGYLDTIDRSTGMKVRPCLISTRTTKERLALIDLAHVDARLCVRNLGSHVSRSATELQAVKPIIEFNMTDRRFVGEGDMSFLSSSQNLMDLNPYEFEKLIVKLFKEMGLDAKLTQSSRDGGVDCVAYDVRPIIGGKVVIQAKRYRHTVGVSAVRDLFGTMMSEGANKGILVTTSGYGPDAFKFVENRPIELIDGSGLLHYLKEVGIDAHIVMPAE